MKKRIASFATASALLLSAMSRMHAQPTYAIVSFSTGGVSGSSTGGIYSVTRTTGPGDFQRMLGADYTVAGNFWPGMILLPELTAGGFYIGIDLNDPVQAAADYDGDGLSNLLEYGLGIDPRNPADAAQALLISMMSDSGTHYLTLQFKRRTNAAGLGLQYLPEVSADGKTWYSDPGHVQELGSTAAFDAQFDWVTVQDLTATTSLAPRFIRLRIINN